LNFLDRARFYIASKAAGFANITGASTVIQAEILRGIITWQGQNSVSFVNDGFCGNDMVYSVVTAITDKAKVSPWEAYKIKDEKQYKMWKGIMSDPKFVQNWKAVEEIKNRALEVYTGDDKLNELLMYPNDEDTFSDFVEGMGIYKLIVGNSYAQAELIKAGVNKGKPNKLNVLPAQYMSIVADVNPYPAQVKGYRLYIGKYYSYQKEEICHDKYRNLRADASGLQLYGMSPLQPAAKLLTRSNASKDASVANLINGGPAAMVSFDMGQGAPTGAATTLVSEMKRRFLEFSGPNNKNKIAIANYPATVNKIGLSNVDLDIIKGEMHDLRQFCNIYHVPSQVLNDPENKAEANAKEGQKSLCTNATLPLLYSLEANLNRKLATDWGYKGKGIVIGPDISGYQELQEDKATQAAWLFNTALPIREKLKIMGLKIPDYMSDDLLNTVYVGTSMQALEPSPDLIDPLDNPTKDQGE